MEAKERVYVRKFDWEEARERHAAGEGCAVIARSLGVSEAAVRRVVVPARERLLAVRLRHAQERAADWERRYQTLLTEINGASSRKVASRRRETTPRGV